MQAGNGQGYFRSRIRRRPTVSSVTRNCESTPLPSKPDSPGKIPRLWSPVSTPGRWHSPNRTSIRRERTEVFARPIDAPNRGSFSAFPQTHSSEESQPVSTRIHCESFPAISTGTQNVPFRAFKGNVALSLLCGAWFRIRIFSAAKSSCTIRRWKNSTPINPSMGW